MKIKASPLKLQFVGPNESEKEPGGAWHFVAISPATWILVAVNLSVFSWIKCHNSLNVSPHALNNYGANWGFQTLSGQWWRLLTSLFVHTETSHLLTNLVGLILFGRRIERMLGAPAFALLYFSCGLSGGILLIAFQPGAAGYGASLSVLGLLGALIGFYSSRLVVISNKARWKLAVLVVIAIISIWDDVSIQSGNPGHIAGLMTGVIFGSIFSVFSSARLHIYAISVLVALMLAASAAAARLCNPVAPHLYAAATAFDAGEKGKALAEIDLVLQIAPDNISANKIAAEIFLNAPDYPRAEKAILKVLAVNKDDDYFLYLFGIIELRTNRCAQANAIAQRLVQLKSKYGPMLSQSPCYIFPKDAR